MREKDGEKQGEKVREQGSWRGRREKRESRDSLKFELIHVCSHDLLAMSNRAAPPPIPMSRKVDTLAWRKRDTVIQYL